MSSTKISKTVLGILKKNVKNGITLATPIRFHPVNSTDTSETVNINEKTTAKIFKKLEKTFDFDYSLTHYSSKFISGQSLVDFIDNHKQKIKEEKRINKDRVIGFEVINATGLFKTEDNGKRLVIKPNDGKNNPPVNLTVDHTFWLAFNTWFTENKKKLTKKPKIVKEAKEPKPPKVKEDKANKPDTTAQAPAAN